MNENFLIEENELLQILKEDIKIGSKLEKLVNTEEWKFFENIIKNQIETLINKLLTNSPEINKDYLIGEINAYRKLLKAVYSSIEKKENALKELRENEYLVDNI